MTMRKIAGLAGFLMLATLAGGTAALAGPEYGPLKMLKTSAGEVLTTPKGMTLYTSDKDTAGVSNCNGECAQYWPPLMAEKDAKPTGKLTLVTRSDGTMQWADNGMPLYTFANDKVSGDVTGDNKNSVWHVVK